MRAVEAQSHTWNDFIHDFSKDGVKAAYAPSNPNPWSSATQFRQLDLATEDHWPAMSINCTGSKIAVTVAPDGAISIYQTSNFALEHVLRGHLGHVSQLVWHPLNENILISSSSRMGRLSEQLIRIWNLAELPSNLDRELNSVARDTSVSVLKMPPFTDHTYDRTEPSETEVDTVFTALQHALQSILINRAIANGEGVHGTLPGFGSTSITSNGLNILYRPNRNTLNVFSFEQRRTILQLSGHTDAIMWASASPDNTVICTSSWDSTVRVWNVVTGASFHTLESSGSQSWGGAISSDSRCVAAGSGDGRVRVWEIQSGELRHAFQASNAGWIRSLSFSPSQSESKILLVAGGVIRESSPHLHVWNICTGSIENTWGAQVDHRAVGFAEIDNVQHCPDGSKFAFKVPDGRLLVYDAEQNLMWEFAADCKDVGRPWNRCGRCFAFSPTEDAIWSLDEDGVLRKWQL